MNLSVFIIAKNEEARIATAINSIKSLASEIIVVDSGSTDNTVMLAQNLGAIVVFNEWHGYVAQKIFAENLCANKWVLNLDADEELSQELILEIKELLKTEPEIKAYNLKATFIHPQDKKAHPLAPYNKCLRLYHRDYASFNVGEPSLYHDNVRLIVPTKIKTLKGILYHRSIMSISQIIKKWDEYTNIQAQEMFNKGRKPSFIRLVFEMPFSFLKFFCLRRYFIYGMNGFIYAMIHSSFRFIRLAKARELFKKY